MARKMIYGTDVPWKGNEDALGSYGYLKINVTAAQQALPIFHAQISVYSDISENAATLMAVLETDESGTTELITLPAPKLANSLEPDIPHPYNLFYVRIAAANYVTKNQIPVQIFPGVVSDLVINLVPPVYNG
jgi:hypothetical protein